MNPLDKVEKLITEGKIRESIEIFIEFTRESDISAYRELLNLASQLNQMNKNENLGLGENEKGRNRITNSVINLLFSIREQLRVQNEIAEKTLIEYPAIPNATWFNHAEVILRGKTNSIYSWAANSNRLDEVELHGGEKMKFICFDILIFNYNSRPLRVINIRESKLKLKKQEVLNTSIGVRSKNGYSLHYPKALEMNNKLIETIKSHYYDIPPFGYMVINNSFEITHIIRKSNLTYEDIEYLEYNPTNAVDDKLVLKQIE